MSTDVLLSLGGNMGDRKALMDDAVRRLGALPKTRVVARSSYYRTAPDGPVKQDWFLNMALAISTDLTREELQAAARAIEAALGRDRSKEISWGPRPIDVDIVAYGKERLSDERPFVLIPVAEIAPADRAGHQADDTGIEKLDWPVPNA